MSEPNTKRRRSFGARLIKTCDGFSACLAIGTVLALPWFLGGVVPLARFVILGGAVVAAAFALPGLVLSRKANTGIPLVSLPIIGLTILGIIQCRPAEDSLVVQMNHAINSVDSGDIPTVDNRHTLSFAHTRTAISLLLALSLLSLTAFRQLRTGKALAISTCFVILNGIVLAGVGLPGLFHEGQFWLNEFFAMNWVPGQRQSSFATFVNPNNAAGWLLLSLSCATGMAWHALQKLESGDQQKYGQLNVPAWENAVRRIGTFVAELNNFQVLSLIIVGFLAAAVCATESRGGIVALIAGIMVIVLTQSNLKSIPIVLIGVALAAAGGYFLLDAFELTEGITEELQTLNKLEDAAGSRPQLWLDSLKVVQDFPIFGTGLGTFQFAILPYQSQQISNWFRNADNHFVDLLVEGGIPGLILFLLPAMIALSMCRAIRILQKKRTHSERKLPRQTSRRVLNACRVALLFTIASTGIATCFDYGIGMPAAASLFVLILSAISGYLSQDHHDNRVSALRRGLLVTGRVPTVVLNFSLLTFAVCLIPDQWASAQLDPLVVRGHRLLKDPSLEDLDNLGNIRKDLEQAIVARPDDPEARRMLTRLAESEVLWIMRQEIDPEIRQAKIIRDAWRSAKLVDVAAFVAKANLKQKLIWQKSFQNAIDQTELAQHLMRTQSFCPLRPTIADSLALVDFITTNGKNLPVLSANARFVRPRNGYILWRLGVYAARSQQLQLASELWTAAIKNGPELQAGILMDAFQFWPTNRTVELFGPKTFAACVTTASNTRQKTLRTALLNEAKQFWGEITSPTAEHYQARHQYLRMTASTDEVLAMLETAMHEYPNHIELIRLYARELDRLKKFNSARIQWDRVNHLSDGDSEAERRMTAIDDMATPSDEESDTE